MNNSTKIAGGVFLAAFVWVASGLFSESKEKPTLASSSLSNSGEVLSLVRTKYSTAVEHQSSLVLFGRTEGVRSVQIKVETAGRIKEVPLGKGSSIKKGDVIARMTMADRQARLKEARALVNRYNIAYEAAQKLSMKQFRSKVQLAESVSNLESAKATLRSVKVDIDRTSVRAPFDGILNDVGIEIGDYVAIGDVSATIVDLDPILVVGEVTEQASSLLKIGDKASIKLIGGDNLDGSISYISKVGSAQSRTFRIEVSLRNPGGTISEGLTTELRLKLGLIKAHFLSPSALTLNELGELGVKTIKSGQVQFHKVQIIDDTRKGVWLTGLPDEVELIVVGQEFVRSNQKVRSLKTDGESKS
jgi:multidrug efflux system membrane fusion protein